MESKSNCRVCIDGPNGKPMWVPESALDSFLVKRKLSPEEQAVRKQDLLDQLRARTPKLQLKDQPNDQLIAQDSVQSPEAPLLRLGLTQEEFEQQFSLYRSDHYDLQKSLGKANPYTHTKIANEDDYLAYLREHFFYQLCSLRLESEKVLMQRQIEAERASVQHQLVVKSNNLNNLREYTGRLENDIKELRSQLDLQANSYASSLEMQEVQFRNAQARYARNLFRIFLFALILCVACSWFFHNKGVKSGYADGSDAGYATGFEAGESEGWDNGYDEGHEAGADDRYDRGYDFGYDQSYDSGKEAARSAYSAGTGSASGLTRDTAIASGYIGNLNTGKFHNSWCGYLPNQENQTVFSSRDAAIAAGYDPCARCHP